MTSTNLDPGKKVEAVVRVLGGEQTAEVAAGELGVTAREIEDWKGIYLQSAAHSARSRRSLRSPGSRRKRLALLAVACCAVLLGSSVALSQATNCVSGLNCFNPNAPAKANDVNSNFEQLTTWLTDKVGAVADSGIQVDSVRVRKSGQTSTISFDAQSNDAGSIIHYENSNTGELWLSSSDDWDAATANDRIVFGEYPSYPRFEVWANGNTRARGSVTADGGLVPSYNSGWFAVSSNNDYSRAHGLGTNPSRIIVQMCGAISGGQWGSCTTRVVQVASRGPIRDDGGYINPVSITSTTSNVYVGLDTANAWGYWSAGAWHYDGDHDANHTTAYYRILAWR